MRKTQGACGIGQVRSDKGITVPDLNAAYKDVMGQEDAPGMTTLELKNEFAKNGKRLSRYQVERFVRKATEAGVMKCAGRKRSVRSDGTTYLANAYQFTEGKKCR